MTNEQTNNEPPGEASEPISPTGNNVRATWQFSLHDIRSNMSHCSAEAKAVMIEAFMWCIDPAHPVTRQEFAKAIDYDATTVWKVYAGKYTAPQTKERLDVPPKMLRMTRQFLELEKERVHGGKTEFVMTPTAKKIWTGCDLARESLTPVFVKGPSHIGKTWALTEYAKQNNHGRTVYIRMKAASGLGGMVRRINEKVGNSANCNTADAIERIKRALTPNTVLLLDEMHELAYTYRIASFFACMEVIREIYDETNCGLVLCATGLLDEKFKEARQGELEQISRRGVHRVALPSMPTIADLTAILKSSGLEFPAPEQECAVQAGKSVIREQPRALLRQLAKTSGLKSITERIRYGKKLASKSKTRLTWHHFVDAHLRIEKQATAEGDWD